LCGLISCVSQHKHLLVHLSCPSITKTKQGPFSRSQAPLKANIVERCRSLNKKKAVLDAKADTSVHSQRLHLLEKELEDLKAKVRATEQHILEEKDLIASSKWEAEALTAQLKVDLAELSALSKQVVPGVDKEDEAVIVEADHVRLEAIAAINEFLQ
jgi:hypothetical protein